MHQRHQEVRTRGWAGSFLGLLGLCSSACVLTGIEPDEIDVADEGLSTDGLDETSGGDESEASTSGTGDGEAGGDGDGDPGTGDGDGDTTGDGDGDPSTGDGDGDPSTGDGDGDPAPNCDGFEPLDVAVGDNPVIVLDQASALDPSCGGLGPERVLRFTAPSAGDWQFEATSVDFVPVVVLVEGCAPLTELACASEPASVIEALGADQVVYVIVDSTQGFGDATLTITAL